MSVTRGRHRVLMVTPELAPFVKVGGLADMVASLSKALAGRGHDVRVVLPRYAGLRGTADAKPLDEPLIVRLGGHEAYARVWETRLPGTAVVCYLLEHNAYFDAETVYVGPTGNEVDNERRFTFFARAALDLCGYLGWMPDVLHGHDWPAGLVPVYLNTTDLARPAGRAASVFTLHNMQHQGCFHRSLIDFAGLPPEVFRSDCLEAQGGVNLLKGAIHNATKITTVSPTYAAEIQQPEGGFGLHNLLRFRSDDLVGVLNGIDETEWDPATDPLVPARFSAADLGGKAVCKRALQECFGLDADAGAPVFVVVSRLVHQKGLDLLVTAVEGLVRGGRLQLAVLGTGEAALENAFRDLAVRHPGRIGAFIGYDNKRAHLLVAGADFLLMPSRFEPCGLSQMYAMRYGALPVVRETGGLVDTVDPYLKGTGAGTGFRFRDPTPEALAGTIAWACDTFHDRPAEFAALRRNAMARDFTWGASARTYEDVYQWARQDRAGAFAREDAAGAVPG